MTTVWTEEETHTVLPDYGSNFTEIRLEPANPEGDIPFLSKGDKAYFVNEYQLYWNWGTSSLIQAFLLAIRPTWKVLR